MSDELRGRTRDMILLVCFYVSAKTWYAGRSFRKVASVRLHLFKVLDAVFVASKEVEQ